MSDARTQIASLSPEQRDALMLRLSQRGVAGAERSPRGPRAETLLSFAQERMWFRHLLVPDDTAHNLAGALRLRGQLSVPALERAFTELFRRQESLRTNFFSLQGEPVLRVRPVFDIRLEAVDLRSLPAAEREAECRRRYHGETVRGFDLERDPLLRSTLLQLGAEEHLLLLTLHHIIADGWSIGVLLGEFAAHYGSAAGGGLARLPELRWSYRDFAAWERERLASMGAAAALAYWRRQLAEPPAILRIPPDQPASLGPPAGAPEGRTCALTLEAQVCAELEKLRRAAGATLFVVLLSAFFVLLRRWTGEEDLIIGAPVSGRTRVELEPLIGLFVNTVALRVRLQSDLTFAAVIARVRQTCLEAFEHHEVPFERVVQEVGPERQGARQPYFDILFNFTPSPPRQMDLEGVKATFEAPPGQGTEFSLQLFITEDGGALDLKLLHPKEHYSAARMECFLDQFRAVLEQAVRNPETTVAAFDLVTARARRLLPDPVLPLPGAAPASVMAKIAEWVEETPGRVALSCGEDEFSYAQLGQGVAVTAARLRAAGLTAGEVAAVSGSRSVEVVMAAIGVLLAGGVLVMLDADLPLERRRVMCREANVRFLFTGDEAPEFFQGCTLRIGDLVASVREASAPRSWDALLRELPETAYIFFTSGSTGVPKAILGTHAGLGHFLQWQRQTFTVNRDDRVAQLTGLSFDVVLRDIFLPLTSGAALCIPQPEDLATPHATLQWLERERISLLHTVPALAESWLIRPGREISLRALRHVFFAGEPLTATLVERWRAAFPEAGEIVNLYGPTETTLAKCFHRVGEALRAGVQPLGVSLPQSQALVLSSSLRQCGLCEPGQIAIRTPHRSRGYLNAPEENERRFLPNPYRDDPHDVVYLTGDRGVYGADGLLEFLGRMDHQVKIRGVRVEPGEVAAVLRQCDGVAASAVIARLGASSETELIAFVVMEGSAARAAPPLAEFLRRRLPPQMQPAAFVFLDALPLTANHKLDRQRLPEPPHGASTAETGSQVAPRSPLEAQLTRLWEEFLPARPIGVTSNFFDLGGHSLLLFRLVLKVEAALGQSVPVQAFLDRPTIEHMAALASGMARASRLLVSLLVAEGRRKLFLIHPGGGTLLGYRQLLPHLKGVLAVYGIQPQGLEAGTTPHDSIQEMAAMYVRELRREQARGPYLLAGHSLGGVIAFEMARQLLAQGDRIAWLAMFDTASPEEGPVGADDDAALFAGILKTLSQILGRKPGITPEALARLQPGDQVEAIRKETLGAEQLAGKEGEALLRNLVKLAKAHARARRHYRPGAAAVPIHFYRAEETADETARQWSRYSTAPLVVTPVSGTHVTMMTEPHVATLAVALRASLA